MAQRITVHDPRGYPPKVVGKRLAPRLASLDGKTVYLVDCLFDNSAVFMEQLQQWFGEHLPAVDARIIRPKETWADDPGDARGHCRWWRRRDSRHRPEACAARRSSGSPRLWKREAPSVAVILNDSRGSVTRPRCRWGCRDCVRRIPRTPSSINQPGICVQYTDGSDAVSGQPFMQVVLDGLTGPLEDADLQVGF